MDIDRLEDLVQSISRMPTRRDLARALAGLGIGGALGLLGLAASEAKKHKPKKKRKERKQKVKRNEFGCVNVGNFCKNSGQCCSGICEGKKDKKTCQAHDQSTCQAGQTVAVCGGTANVACTTSTGDEDGVCVTTTGNGGYCVSIANCFLCEKDADCVAVCGPQAACIPCVADCPLEGTACASPDFESCNFYLGGPGQQRGDGS